MPVDWIQDSERQSRQRKLLTGGATDSTEAIIDPTQQTLGQPDQNFVLSRLRQNHAQSPLIDMLQRLAGY